MSSELKRITVRNDHFDISKSQRLMGLESVPLLTLVEGTHSKLNLISFDSYFKTKMIF